MILNLKTKTLKIYILKNTIIYTNKLKGYNIMNKIIDSRYVTEQYFTMALNLLKKSFPDIDERVISDGIKESIVSRIVKHDAQIVNDYKGFTINTNTLELADYIYEKKPILTGYGVMFSKHGYTPNLISMLLTEFLDSRDAYKKERKKYQKGSKDFIFYDRMQLLSKLDANALYGAQGNHTSIFYNLYTAASVTATGQSIISTAGLFFESFLHNNVKFGSFDELVGFIYNVINEQVSYSDYDILDRDVSVVECFEKIIMTSGFDWVPNKRQMNIIYNMISNLTVLQRNRLFYKNNLYDFIENKKVRELIINIVSNMKEPMIFPTSPPENVKEDLDKLLDLLHEFVYYGHQIVDRLDKYSTMYRSVSIITDTDSVIVSLDNWYRYILDMTKDVDLPLRYIETSRSDAIIDGTIKTNKTNKQTDDSDEAIKLKSELKPDKVPPQEGLRYSIVNMMAYCLDSFINEYMRDYVKSCNGLNNDDDKCLLIFKNEFLFRRVLLTDNKKNYASIQELQEGTIVPPHKSLDIKGLAINKSTLNSTSRAKLQAILKEKVLMPKAEDLNQVEVIKAIQEFENEIFQSLSSGDKRYYKPVVIKPANSYDNPLGIQGIKAAMVYNIIKDEYQESIVLTQRNKLHIVKVNINKKNIHKIRDIDERIYNELNKLLDMKEFKNGITTIAAHNDYSLPKWILDFIDYTAIISDNLKNFPIEEIGIYRGRESNPYTNIISF